MPEPPKLEPIADKPLSVVLLAYNEATHLESTIASWLKTLRKREIDFEILLIDDGSTDETKELSEQLAEKETALTVHCHESHQGLGSAISTGFEHAQHSLIAVALCDPTYRAEELQTFLKQADSVHLVTAYRAGQAMPLPLRLLGGFYRIMSRILLSLPKRPLPGFLGRRGHTASFLARLVFGLRIEDVACPYFLIRKEILEHAPIQSKGAFGIIELFSKVNYLKGLFHEEQIPLQVEPSLGKWRDETLKQTWREANLVFGSPDFSVKQAEAQ